MTVTASPPELGRTRTPVSPADETAMSSPSSTMSATAPPRARDAVCLRLECEADVTPADRQKRIKRGGLHPHVGQRVPIDQQLDAEARHERHPHGRQAEAASGPVPVRPAT